MIKVNLISVAPGQAAPAREWFPKEQRSAAVGLVLLVSTAVGVTSWWWYLSHERRNVQQATLAAELELHRLKDVAVLVERATTRKAELADRLDLIERLRATMRGPVRLLETVSQSVPHGLWLLEVKQTGTVVQLDGRAMSLTPVTDFAKVMQESGFFQMPVEIVSTTSEMFEEVPVIRFVMKAEVVPASAPAVKATPVVTDSPATAPSSAGASNSPLNAEALPAPPGSAQPASAPIAPAKTDAASVRSGGK